MHDHDHDHLEDRKRPARQRRLVAALSLAVLYMTAEAVGGWLSNSLALLADAGHMLSDVAALGLSLFAIWMSSRPATPQRTFGYQRAEILAALVNGALLLAVSGGILHEAWRRWSDPPDIDATTMLAVAVGGLLVNVVMLWILHGSRAEDLNLRGAWLHVLGDTLGSIGVIAAAVCVRVAGLTWVDPLASAIICLLIVVSAGRLLKDAVDVLMETAPSTISVEDVRRSLLEMPGVRDVHCLHVWTIASGRDSLSAHVVVDANRLNAAQLDRLRTALLDRFAVEHITLQLEPEGFLSCSDQILEHCQSTPPRSMASAGDAASH